MNLSDDERELARRRSDARRTAAWLAVVAATIFGAFFLTGVLGR